MSVSGEICYRLARYLVRRRHLGAAGANPNSFTRGSYQDWRRRELERQYTTNFALDLIRGKDVVDFGCGGGELSLFVLRHGARTVTGVEISEAQYELALSNCKERGYLDRIQFVLSQHSDVVPLPSESADVILCFDVLEHVLEYDRVITEWLRILRSNGILLIWWAPYHHPYGHHVESLVPIPWIHVILSDDAILESCARIYDSEEFTPRIWDLDEQGNKKPNKWKDIKKLPDVNKLSIREFESIARNVGFSFDRQEYRPISSSVVAKKIASALQRFPSSRELTTSCVTYQLRKP